MAEASGLRAAGLSPRWPRSLRLTLSASEITFSCRRALGKRPEHDDPAIWGEGPQRGLSTFTFSQRFSGPAVIPCSTTETITTATAVQVIRRASSAASTPSPLATAT